MIPVLLCQNDTLGSYFGGLFDGFGDFFFLGTRDFLVGVLRTLRHLPFDPLTWPSLHGFGDLFFEDLRARDFLTDGIYYTIRFFFYF